MTISTNKPYLIIPTCIEQQTWGGRYIVEKKHWDQKQELKGLRIGQSYELYGKSRLSLACTDSGDDTFSPTLVLASGNTLDFNGLSIRLDELTQTDMETMLGPIVAKSSGRMPILIKFTQAKGNSFQIHIPRHTRSDRWIPKAESWYFLEKGNITLGLKKSCSIEDYTSVCLQIEQFMKTVSFHILDGTLLPEKGRAEADSYINTLDPWQFVNPSSVEKGTIIDLSTGGIHHSWEEDQNFPEGNIIYEVQEDVDDASSTIRAFDQGKFLSDGSVRTIHIKEYFKYLDKTDSANDIRTHIRKQRGKRIFNTPYYVTDELRLTSEKHFTTGQSFTHLFILSGSIIVSGAGGSVRITEGHSGLIPWKMNDYVMTPKNGMCIVLKTAIE